MSNSIHAPASVANQSKPRDSFQILEDFCIRTDDGDEEHRILTAAAHAAKISRPPTTTVTAAAMRGHLPVFSSASSTPLATGKIFSKQHFLLKPCEKQGVTQQIAIPTSNTSSVTLLRSASMMQISSNQKIPTVATAAAANGMPLIPLMRHQSLFIQNHKQPLKQHASMKDINNDSSPLQTRPKLKTFTEFGLANDATGSTVSQPQYSPHSDLTKTSNIFASKVSQESNNLGNTLSFNKGPRFYKDGSIVRHTIVGKPEWFIAAAEDSNNNITQRDSMNSRQQGRGSVASKLSYIGQRNSSANESPSRILRSAQMMRVKQKKKLLQNDANAQMWTKQDLLSKLNDVENRIQENNLREAAEIKSKTIEPSHQTNTLHNFDVNVKRWNSISSKISQAIMRSSEQTLLKSSVPQHRQKVEINQAIEQVKHPKLILGDKFWEATLRDKFVEYSVRNKPPVNDEEVAAESVVAALAKQEDRTGLASSQMNRSFYRELSYSKGSMVAVHVRKEFEVIKHPNTIYSGSQQPQSQQESVMGMAMPTRLGDSMVHPSASNLGSRRNLMSSQQSRRLISMHSMNNSTVSEERQLSTHPQQVISSVHLVEASFGMGTKNARIMRDDQNCIDRMSQFCTAFQADADELIIKGDNKLKIEKQALLNDGNRFAFYRHFPGGSVDEKAKKPVSETKEIKTTMKDNSIQDGYFIENLPESPQKDQSQQIGARGSLLRSSSSMIELNNAMPLNPLKPTVKRLNKITSTQNSLPSANEPSHFNSIRAAN